MNKIALASAVVAIVSSALANTASAQSSQSRNPYKYDFSGAWRVSGNLGKGMPKRVYIGQVGGLRATNTTVHAEYPPIAKCPASGVVIIKLFYGQVVPTQDLPSELWEPRVTVPGVTRTTNVLTGSITLCESKKYVKYCRGGKGGATYRRPFVATFVTDPTGKVLSIKGTYKSAHYKLFRHKGNKGRKARYSCQRHQPGDTPKRFVLTRIR